MSASSHSEFLIEPYANAADLSPAARIVSMAYPALDVLLLAVVIRLMVDASSRGPAFRLLALSLFSLLAADAAFTYATLHGTYHDGGLIDLGWLVSYTTWGCAALHPSMAALSERPREFVQRGKRVALPLLAVAALVAPTVLFVKNLEGAHQGVGVLAVMAALTFVLVIARLGVVTRELDRSNRGLQRASAGQRVLRSSAMSMLTKERPDEIAVAATEAAVKLAGEVGTWAVFVETGGDGFSPTASAGELPSTDVLPSPADAAAWWRDRELFRGATVEDDRVIAPVIVDGELRGILVVGALGTASRVAELVVPIGLLGTQAGLALKASDAVQARMQARSERLFRSVVQSSSDLVTLVDDAGLIRYQSPGVEQVMGLQPDETLGLRLDSFVHPDDVESARNRFAMVVAAGLGAQATFECRVQHVDGTWRDIEIAITNLLADPDVGTVVLNSRDVTVRRALEQKLHTQAFRDSLTGLPNRALFVDRLVHALDRSERDAAPVAVLFLDLDDFKLINDSLGHPTGDTLLIEVANRLIAAVRPGDTVARFGGDEFAIMLETGEVPAGAEAVSARIAEALSVPFHVGSDDVSVRASIGIAMGRPQECGSEDLLRDADLAMYMAKRNGKGRFEMYRPSMHDEAVHRLEMAGDLRRAIEQGQLELVYQPIVDIDTRRPVGAEALVRWRHPTRGVISPAEFIPVAESTGLIVPLGRWVIEQACRDAGDWCTPVGSPAPYVSVNVSSKQLQDREIIEDVTRAISRSGLPANALLVEVTESALMSDVDLAITRLLALKELGVRVAVDDFGTGYSSLSYLHNLPVDVVKIDKSFIDRMTQDPAGTAMVRTVIELTRTLNLVSVAEGVEEDAQLEILAELGCSSFQGYLASRPIPATTVRDMLMDLETAPERKPPTLEAEALS